MKRIKLLLISMIVGSISFLIQANLLVVSTLGLSGCFREYLYPPPNPPDTSNLFPSIYVDPPNSSYLKVIRGEVINFHIVANSHFTSKVDLKDIRMIISGNVPEFNLDTVWIPDSNQIKEFIKDFDFTIPSLYPFDSIITVTFTVRDTAYRCATKTLKLEVHDLSGLHSYYGIKLGAQANDIFGSFYSTHWNKTYQTTLAQLTGQTTIDLVYFYHPVYQACFASPDNQDVFGTDFNQISSLNVHLWTTKNSTRFKRINPISENEWEALDGRKITEKYAAGKSETNMAGFLYDTISTSTPSHIAFKTGIGKYGFLRIKEISAYDSTGTVTIDIKVQK